MKDEDTKSMTLKFPKRLGLTLTRSFRRTVPLTRGGINASREIKEQPPGYILVMVLDATSDFNPADTTDCPFARVLLTPLSPDELMQQMEHSSYGVIPDSARVELQKSYTELYLVYLPGYSTPTDLGQEELDTFADMFLRD